MTGIVQCVRLQPWGITSTLRPGQRVTLWVGPGSMLPFSAENVATRLVRLITGSLAGPFSNPVAQRVRMYASSPHVLPLVRR